MWEAARSCLGRSGLRCRGDDEGLGSFYPGLWHGAAVMLDMISPYDTYVEAPRLL